MDPVGPEFDVFLRKTQEERKTVKHGWAIIRGGHPRQVEGSSQKKSMADPFRKKLVFALPKRPFMRNEFRAPRARLSLPLSLHAPSHDVIKPIRFLRDTPDK